MVIRCGFSSHSSPHIYADSRLIIKSASDFPASLSSTVQYYIDGAVDLGSRSLEVPAGGLNISGLGASISKIYSTEDSYTMFTSPVDGSGGLNMTNITIDVSGSGSQVYDLEDATGFNAVEVVGINYENCTSLGQLDGYRQGLEDNTGRFGGSPNLILEGDWEGGFAIFTSIVRSLDAGMTGALFEAGVSFTMGSRFVTNMNVDLPASAALLDFAPANFTNPSTLVLEDTRVTRSGAADAADTNLTPNIASTSIKSSWSGNVGLDNTHEGGKLTVTAQAETTVASSSTFYDVSGVTTSVELQHFDSPANFQLRHLSDSPRDFEVVVSLIVECTQNNELELKLVKWDESVSSFVDVGTSLSTVDSLSGIRDTAKFNVSFFAQLDIDDYVKIQISNNDGSQNYTVENGSYMLAKVR